jgi:hypothetical protein
MRKRPQSKSKALRGEASTRHILPVAIPSVQGKVSELFRWTGLIRHQDEVLSVAAAGCRGEVTIGYREPASSRLGVAARASAGIVVVVKHESDVIVSAEHRVCSANAASGFVSLEKR